MGNSKLSCNGVGDFAIFNHENDAASQIAGVFLEPGELVIGLVTDRALRAMLENENRIGFGSLEKLFEISMLLQFKHHIFRLTDSNWIEEK